MSIETVQTLIIGGGISGLCAALSLGDEALILEKEAEPGGYCRSIRQDGFLWDWAGHFFHFRTERGRRFFLSLFAPDELTEQQKRCRILYRGKLIDYPFQRNIHQLDREELLDCLSDLFERPFLSEPENFLDMLYGRYGRSITDKFLRPYNEKLLSCELRELSPGAMGRFFPAADPDRIDAGFRQRRDESYNSRFFYPKNGAGALVEKLCARIAPDRILCGRSLVRLDPERHIAYDDKGGCRRYERLINTAPLDRFLPLLGTEEARLLASSLSASRVLVLNLGFERKAPIRGLHWLYVSGPDAPYYRVGFYDAVQGGERASLYVEISFAPGAAIDEVKALSQTLFALRAQGLIQEDNRLVSHKALLMDPAYVHIRTQSEREIRAMLAGLSAQGIRSIGRYGGWRYSSVEDDMLEALTLAESMKQREKP